MIEKQLVFDKVFSILLLQTCENNIFQKEVNHAPQLDPSCHREIFSSNGSDPDFCGGRGEILVIFGPCDLKNSVKEASENLVSMTNFALLIKIYLLGEFHKFSPSCF